MNEERIEQIVESRGTRAFVTVFGGVGEAIVLFRRRGTDPVISTGTRFDLVDVRSLATTHTVLGFAPEDRTNEEILATLDEERWSPDGEGFDLVRIVGAACVSMGPGDLVVREDPDLPGRWLVFGVLGDRSFACLGSLRRGEYPVLGPVGRKNP